MKKAILISALLLYTVACGTRQQPIPESLKEAVQSETPAGEPKEHLSGAFTNFRIPTEEELTLFRRMTSELKGVTYTADSVATQVVAGKNYRFLCTARTVSDEPRTYNAEIIVFAPLPCKHEEPRIVKIARTSAAL